MTTAPSSVVFGATGLVGSHLVTALLGLDAFGPVHTITRRTPKQAADADKAPQSKLDAIVEADTAQWVSRLQALGGSGDADAAKKAFPPTIFSALGTTRAAAGGIANQWKIDHDLNVDIAKAAKAAGARTFVFVSSASTRTWPVRNAPYPRMKNGVEDAIQGLDFDHAVILKPGLILGKREVEKTGGPLLNAIVYGLGHIATGLQDALGQEADVIARAAAHAALLVDQGKAPSKFWVLEAADIIRLGRDEWTF